MVLFIVALLSYLPGISRNVFGADSGDIILASYFAGIAHPQGYPLNSTVGWIFTHLPLGTTVAYKANLMMAFLQALTVGIIFLILNKILKNKPVSLVSSLVLAFNALFWLYAHVAEVFQMTALLISLSVYFLMCWRETYLQSKSIKSGKNINKYLYLCTTSLGFAFFHHYLSVLVFPAFFYLVIKTNKQLFYDFKLILRLGLLFLSGIFPYLLVPISVILDSPINWMGLLTSGNFVRLLTRADYGSFNDFQDFVGFSPITRLFQLEWYLKAVNTDFTLIGVFLIAIGFVNLFFKHRALFWFLLLAWFFTGPFFFLYLSFPPYDIFIQAIVERFLLPSYVFLVLILGFGIKFIYDLIFEKLSPHITKKSLLRLMVVLLLMLFPIHLISENFPKTDLSNYIIGQTIAEDILSTADPPGVIFLQGDTIILNTLYSWLIDGVNEKSIIVMAGRLRRPSYRNVFFKQHPELNFPNDFLSNELADLGKLFPEFIDLNFDDFPIYSVTRLSPLPASYTWVREGYLNRLYKNNNVPSDDHLLKTIEKNLSKSKFYPNIVESQYRHFMTDHIITLYVNSYITIGDELFARNLDMEAQKYYLLAYKLAPDYGAVFIRLGDIYLYRRNCNTSENFYLKASKHYESRSVAYEKLEILYKDCFKNEDKAASYRTKAEETRTPHVDIFKEF